MSYLSRHSPGFEQIMLLENPGTATRKSLDFALMSDQAAGERISCAEWLTGKRATVVR